MSVIACITYRGSQIPSSLIKQRRLNRIGQEFKRHAVVFAAAMLCNGSVVVCRRVTFVRNPIIHRVCHMQIFHVLIPIRFCQNGCRINGCIDAIALDDAGKRYVLIRNKSIAVYKNVLRSHVKSINRFVHGF